jgi:hypothetical protein
MERNACAVSRRNRLEIPARILHLDQGRAMKDSEPGNAATTIADYYRSVHVQARIAEYCGGLGAGMSAWDLAGFGGRDELAEEDGAPVTCRAWDHGRLFERGADVSRSLGDRDGTLLHLDLDYSHPADPDEPYRDPATCFRLLEPVYQAIVAAFSRHAVQPLVLVTGRGYHFVVRARRGSLLQQALAAMGGISPAVRARADSMSEAVPGATAMCEAHDGAGRLLEHLCHEVLSNVAAGTPLPVAIADLPPPGGGRFACLDLSAYGDPLFARHARCAFSSNQKASLERSAGRPFVLVIPRTDGPIETLLRTREDPGLAARLAASCSGRIPEVTAAPEWLRAYRTSALARFHGEFDAGPHADPSTWRFTYDALDPRALPPCVAGPLEQPYPALLQPLRLRTLALALRSMGWHARSVAALVASRYERGSGWGSLWWRYDRETRAAFYVRLLLASADRVADAADLSCEVQRRRAHCPADGACGFDLQRLAPGRPFA